jgi:multiple sugar transport system permease protein
MTTSRNRFSPWLFVLPSLTVILLVTIFPTIYSIGLSFFKYEPTLKETPFIGLGNYAELFRNDRFIHAAGVTALLVIIGVFIELVFGFWFANFVHGSARGRRIIVTLMLLPVMVMPVVVGYTWKLLWDAQFGPINQIVGWVIGRPFIFTWLGQPSTAVFAMIVTDVWQWTPFMFLIFYAGMAGLDAELYEAAELDGASGWQQFWRMTVPLMRPIIIVAVLIRSLDAIKAFDVVYTLTGGAPGTSTETVSFFIYKAGYQFFRLGFGAAAAVVMLIVLTIALTFLLRILRRSMA